MASGSDYVHLDAIGVTDKTRKLNDGRTSTYRLAYTEIYPHRGKDLPDNFIRNFLPDNEFFSKMKKPRKSDWLACHSEKGQTFRDFAWGNRMTPIKPKNVIYLLPLVFFEDPVPDDVLQSLQTFAEMFFGLKVKIMKTKNLQGKITSRVNDMTDNYQVNAGEIIRFMRSHIPKDAFCVAGITMCDLYPRESWNFVFGLANLAGSSGVYSLARYLSNFGKYKETRYEPECEAGGEPLLKRACKTMCHEIGHMFGLKHCIHFQCIMNGSNHLDESDIRPIFLCPLCLRKLQLPCQFDIIERYREMETFWLEHGLKDDADWLNRRIKHLTH